MSECPKCNFERKPNAIECPRCGIVYEKYKNYTTKKSNAPSKQPDEKKLNTQDMDQGIPNIDTTDGGKASGKYKKMLIVTGVCIVLIIVAFLYKGGINSELNKQSTEAIKEFDELKYGFKVGLNYINFKNQKYAVQIKIAGIEETHSNKSNLNDIDIEVISAFVSAGIYLEIIDCLWEDKIEKQTLTIPIDQLYAPESTAYLCVTDYTDVNRQLGDKLFYKNAYAQLKIYKDSLSNKGEAEDKIIKEAQENAREILMGESSYSEFGLKKSGQIQESLYSPYISDFMNMYSDSVDKIHSALK